MSKKKQNIKDFIDGSILTKESIVKEIPFIAFLVLIAIIYIANRFHAEKLIYQAARLETEIRELKAQSVTITSELMAFRSRDEVKKMITEYNLKIQEVLVPPKVIDLNVKDKNKE